MVTRSEWGDNRLESPASRRRRFIMRAMSSAVMPFCVNRRLRLTVVRNNGVAGAAYSQVTRCRASYDNEIGPCSGEFGLKNASQFDWMGMSVRTATHRYVEWRNWSGDALAPVWAGAAVAIELYAHSASDGGDFDSYVNGESVNIATDVASAPVVEALAAQIRTVFQPENIGVVAVPTAEAVLNAMAKLFQQVYTLKTKMATLKTTIVL